MDNQENYKISLSDNFFDTQISLMMKYYNNNFYYYNFLENKEESRDHALEKSINLSLRKNIKGGKWEWNFINIFDGQKQNALTGYNWGDYFDEAYVEKYEWISGNRAELFLKKVKMNLAFNYHLLKQKYYDKKHPQNDSDSEETQV